MKIVYKIGILSFSMAILGSCQKDDITIVDVPFTADNVTVKVNETVNFSVGSGADLSSIFTGDVGKDFQKSRIALVEQKGYTEEYLRNNLVAEKIPGLKEYYFRVPATPQVPAEMSITDSELKIYEGKLVTWDVSNVTNSKYLQFKAIGGGKSQIFTLKPNKAVLPGMLKYTNTNLSALGALNNLPNNAFQPFMSFPDGFNSQSQTGVSVKFGIQLVIDGKESDITYFAQTVRELLDNQSVNLANVFTAWFIKFPTGIAANGIDEIRYIINADDPKVTDDDGELMDYKGNVFIQEVRVGSADNMIKAFDKGISVPYIYSGTKFSYPYKYTNAGTYQATLVSVFIGRKQYSGDGYRTNRADEVLFSEYPLERTYKNITITVQ